MIRKLVSWRIGSGHVVLDAGREVLDQAQCTVHTVDAVVRESPIGRWGRDKPTLQAVLALIETDFVTGETLRVDGGRHLR